MSNQIMSLKQKMAQLSPGLRKMITVGERRYTPSADSPVSNSLVQNKRHCNGGRTVDAGLWLRDFCEEGGKIFLSMAGAGSSFQLGVPITRLMDAGYIAGMSVTGANMEESAYRFSANQYYVYIPNYQSLTPKQEEELRRLRFRRITDTILPEDESVRVILPKLMKQWRIAGVNKERKLWHQYFYHLFKHDLIRKDPTANAEECWLRKAAKLDIPLFVPGFEDSTMGNIFAQACYKGDHWFLKNYKIEAPIDMNVVLPGISYMHALAEFYMDVTRKTPLAFVQLGGGIAGDFAICVVPHLKHDFLADESHRLQDKLIRPWGGFVEYHTSPMSVGSYSGAGANEKITWDKVTPKSFGMQIFGDYTTTFPDTVSLMLRE